MEHNYLVSVFVGGKNVNMYFSENLDALVTIKALYKDCEICIFDMCNYVRFTNEQVASAIQESGIRWNKYFKRREDGNLGEVIFSSKKPQKREKTKKHWERRVLCIETGEVFNSIRECCECLGISHKSLWNAINSGNARNGLHFTNASDYDK